MNFKALSMNFFCYKKACRKTLLVTKLTIILIIAGCMQVSAKGFGQKISISGKDMPLEKVFSLIEKEAGYVFFFNYDILQDARKVTVSIKDANIEETMEACLKDQPLEFRIVDKTITITKKIEVTPDQESGLTTSSPLEIIGVVRSENGIPLAGATVTIKSLKKSGVTNEKGEFVLKNVPNGTYWIEISFVGYENHRAQIIVSDNTIHVIVELKPSNDILDETQVIAYGTTTKRFMIGNVTTVKGEDIEKQPVSNPLLALEGRVPGLFIAQANGLPGGGLSVKIQGQNSIANGNDPFYVIDGVPYYSELPPGTDNGNVLGGPNSNGSPFSYISPSDIESIEILKDADATAIYGSRAANGAILITTKKGKAGKTRFDANLQQGWGQVTRKLPMLNTQEYLEVRHEAKANDNKPALSTDYDINGFWDTTRYTDWQKTLIGGTTQYTNIDGSVSGGTNTIQYLVGGNFHRETTVFPGNFKDQKGSLHFNLNNASADQHFHFQFSGSYLFDDDQLPQTDLTSYSIVLVPDAPKLYNPDGSLNWAPNASGTSTWSNPLSNAYETYENKTSNLISNAILGYRILPGVEIRSSFGYTNMQTNDFVAVPLISMKPEDRASTQNSASYANRNLNSWIIEPQVSFNRFIGKGKMDLLAGTTIEQNNSNGQNLYGLGYSSDQLLGNIAAASSVHVSSTLATQYKYNALFGRLSYNWNNKYIVNVTSRRDGSSRFGSQNQFHDFWSMGGAWLFSEENFIQKAHLISFGKLRSSYGTTGSDQIGDYQYLSLYNIIQSNGVPYQNSTGLLPANLPNPYLQWEETRKLQIGMDLGFFRDRILINATYARNRSFNQLLPYALPSFVGFGSIASNFPATVQNTSWEFSLNTTNIKTEYFTWTSRINLTIPENRLIAFPDLALSSYASSLIIGQPVGIRKVYHFFDVDPTTGHYQFLNSHGSPTFTPSFPTDQTVIINPFPHFYGGIENNIEYKGFQLDFLFQFVTQEGTNVSFYNGSTYPGHFSNASGNQPITVLDRWRKPGDKATIAEYSTITNPIDVAVSDYRYSNNAGAFVRLKNLSLSWALPSQRKHNMTHLASSRIYVQCQNLLTITRYKGLDPENQGITALPPLRVCTVGLQVGF